VASHLQTSLMTLPFLTIIIYSFIGRSVIMIVNYDFKFLKYRPQMSLSKTLFLSNCNIRVKQKISDIIETK